MPVIGLGAGVGCGIMTQLAIVGLGRDRHVMDVHPYARLPQLGKHPIPVGDPDHIEVVAAAPVIHLAQGLHRQPGQQFVVAGGKLLALLDKPGQAAKLACASAAWMSVSR